MESKGNELQQFYGSVSVSSIPMRQKYLANRYRYSLNGLGAGPGETLQPAIIADLFFLHDRGKFNTLYFLIYFGSLTVFGKRHSN